MHEVLTWPDPANPATALWPRIGHPPVLDGFVTRTLSFSNMTSDPVTITFTNGVPDVTNYIFRMKEAR